MTLLAKRYAAALFALAAEQSAIDDVHEDVAAIGAVMADPAARWLLTSPDIKAAEREQVLGRLSAGRHALVANLIGVIAERRRLEVLFDLAAAFDAFVMEHRGEVAGTAESAHPLTDAELASLQALAGRLSGKKVTLKPVLDKKLLGGVRLVVCNVLYDGSLRAALSQLESRLLQTSV
jgi:F-type H+-transporting ATPase subunit delta